MVVVEDTEETITTGVDALIALLKEIDTIELAEAAKKVKMPISVVQSWVDFLVEEKIIGLEYKFTTPYIYLNKQKEKTKVEVEEEKASISKFKNDFRQKALDKQIPAQHTNELWKNHLLQKIEKKKEFFFREARKKDLSHIENLWEEYKEIIVEM